MQCNPLKRYWLLLQCPWLMLMTFIPGESDPQTLTDYWSVLQHTDSQLMFSVFANCWWYYVVSEFYWTTRLLFSLWENPSFSNLQFLSRRWKKLNGWTGKLHFMAPQIHSFFFNNTNSLQIIFSYYKNNLYCLGPQKWLFHIGERQLKEGQNYSCIRYAIDSR